MDAAKPTVSYLMKHDAYGVIIQPTDWDSLMKELKKCDFPFPKPNIDKMRLVLERGSIFSYACRMIHVLKITNNEQG